MIVVKVSVGTVQLRSRRLLTSMKSGCMKLWKGIVSRGRIDHRKPSLFALTYMKATVVMITYAIIVT